MKLWPKGLGQARNLIGIYRLCLTDQTVNFIKLNSDVPAVVLQLMNVRRCGHSENFFFIEVGRSAVTGPGEFWMQVDDSVVAQNMHETLLEAMKALSEEFRQRSKTQAAGTSCGGGTASNPISVPSRRHHPNMPPSQVGFSRRSRTETPGVPHSTNTSPTSRHSFSRSRTASIGARTDDRMTALSTSPSLNSSSCSTTPTLRVKPTRAPTPAKITLSLAPYAPKNPAPSPAPSLSSSSGHGSECGLTGAPLGAVPICTYARIPQRGMSMSGSPSDYGSSDEYGSSPGEHSLLNALADVSTGCILLRHQDHAHKRVHGRRIFRRSSCREYEAERKMLSKRTSLPPSCAQSRPVPHCKERDDEGDYAVMSRSSSRESFIDLRGSGTSTTAASCGQVETLVNKGVNTKEVSEGAALDSGYMSMMPGVTAHQAGLALSESKGQDEYMAMTPNNSVSPPQQIRFPVSEGYMMMSPNSSCSPDLHALSRCLWGSRSSMESRAGSDYMNMSPISARSACSTPPSHSDQHPSQPKMVYSYFSLPRSYKHTALSTRFEENLGIVKKPESVSKARGGCGRRPGRGGYPTGDDASVGPNVSSHLSLSSSSFSSSSASTESLDEKPLSLPPGVVRKVSTGHRVESDHHYHQQRQGHGAQKQGHPGQRKGRPFSLSVDVSKANTLPRAKETLQPPGSQNSGDYVSIVYGSDHNRELISIGQACPVVQGDSRTLHQPSQCQGGTNLPRSFSAPLSSDYVKMELGSSPSMIISFNPNPVIVPKAIEKLAGALQTAQDAEKVKTKDVGVASFTDYKEIALGLDTLDRSLLGPIAGKTAEPEQSMDFHSLQAFPASEIPQIVRADTTGRRRHRSDTFNVSSGIPLCSVPATPPPSGSSRHHSLESSLWASGQASTLQAGSPAMAALPATQSLSSSLEQGLNYIDLDLVAKDNPQTSLDRSSGTHFSVLGGGTVAGSTSSNTYASIDFYKSEELRVQHNTRNDNKGLWEVS